jgi:hypothetical protein
MRVRRPRRGHRLAAVSLAAALLPFAAFDPAPPPARGAESPATSEALAPLPQPSPVLLLAAVERAWGAGDGNALASLCDSATVRIAIKPGSPPATAPTLKAIAFLIHDQLDLVVSRRFQVVRVETDLKKRSVKAWARWLGSWGGIRGDRDIEVVLMARATGEGGWLLTEIRAND